ncbi:hypothetical protein PRK78_007084 [Emydomyces testavorans]|uniref:Uncharacterized protein n=1 Tax=Emydomyces testavorans TaxID=2070801 RepID=A0AAF0DNF3_9EURO|nr:hypothetical protein PRK78_007084 [Emydomyces testavorans]
MIGRDLVHQRDEASQSTPADATELEKKLRELSNTTPASPSPEILTPPPPSMEELRESQLEIEKEAFKALVEEGGIPSQPIELGFDILDNPTKYEDYKDIVLYWGSRPVSGHRLGFVDQLNEWRNFRQSQQRIRQYYIRKGTFPEYQRKVRERRHKHGLGGDVELCQDRDQQSRLATWVEYQDYQLRKLETFEKDVKKIEGVLDTARKRLTDAGISGFSSVFEPDKMLALNFKHDGEQANAKDREDFADEALAVAKNRLRAVHSGDFGETVNRSTWISLAQERVKSLSEQRDKLGPDWQGLDKETKREWFATTKELRRAQKTLEVTQLDDFGEMVPRATLLRLISDEVQSAQVRLDEAIKSHEQAKLRGKELGALTDLALTERKLKQHMILMTWIEQKRQLIISECTSSSQDSQRPSDQCAVVKSQTKTLRSHTISEPSRRNRSSKGAGREKQQQTPSSPLKPIQPSKISKKPTKKVTGGRRKRGATGKEPQSTEDATTDSQHSSTKQISRPKEITPPPLKAINSSRVSKPRTSGRSRSRKLDVNATESVARHRNKNEAPSARQKRTEQLASARSHPRRSSRIRKRPERFCPG